MTRNERFRLLMFQTKIGDLVFSKHVGFGIVQSMRGNFVTLRYRSINDYTEAFNRKMFESNWIIYRHFKPRFETVELYGIDRNLSTDRSWQIVEKYMRQWIKKMLHELYRPGGKLTPKNFSICKD